MKNKAIFILFTILCSTLIFQSYDMFRGKKGIMIKKDNLKEKVGNDVKDRLAIQITSPADGDIVASTFSVEGIAGDAVESVEVQIDNGTWSTATGTKKWKFQVNAAEGNHTISARSISKYDFIAQDIIAINVQNINISASDGSYTNKIRITWNSIIGVERYHIFRSTTAHGIYFEIGSTNSTYYDDTGMTNITIYYYKIKTYSVTAGYSDFSNYDLGTRGATFKDLIRTWQDSSFTGIWSITPTSYYDDLSGFADLWAEIVEVNSLDKSFIVHITNGTSFITNQIGNYTKIHWKNYVSWSDSKKRIEMAQHWPQTNSLIGAQNQDANAVGFWSTFTNLD